MVKKRLRMRYSGIDSEIVELVRVLNLRGARTYGSCAGHDRGHGWISFNDPGGVNRTTVKEVFCEFGVPILSIERGTKGLGRKAHWSVVNFPTLVGSGYQEGKSEEGVVLPGEV